MTRSEATRLRAVARVVLAASLAGVVLGGGRAARAQASDPEVRPTRGPLITDAARAGDADATGVELNPAQLGLLPGGSLELIFAGGTGAGADASRTRRGAGGYWAAPIFGPNALGIGLTGVTGSGGFEGHTDLRLAYGLRLGHAAAIGAAWAHIWSGTFAGTDTFDFGLSLRAGRLLALGVTMEDAWQPVATPRLWTAELVARPLGTDRFELAIGAAHANADPWGRVVPRARLSVTVIDGLRVYGEGERVPVAGGPVALDGGADTRVGFGLALDFGRLGGAFGVYGRFPGTGDNGASVAARLHVSGQRGPALIGTTAVVRVPLEGIEDDRAFVALVQQLRGLAAEGSVAAVLFKVENVQLGTARIEELRDQIGFLRAHGKRVFVYAPALSMREYYLAAAADGIVLHPAGELALTGISQSVLFYKTAMDRLGVHVDLVRIANFKGAMEPFIMNEQSPDVRANKAALLDDVFDRMTGAIAADRTRAGKRIDAAEVRALIDRGVYTPAQAQAAGLVDGVADQGQLEAVIGRALGQSNTRITDLDRSPIAPGAWPGRRVAVVMLDGTIVDGPSQELPFGIASVAGSDTLLAALEDCRTDPTVAAVVLRVNSPGGSAFASDVIARAVVMLRAAGKPVIVSMGDLAASGGYYVSAPADFVFAEPSTVTGSIGIFGFKVSAGRLLDLLGVNVETARRGARADYLSPYRPWTEAEAAMVMDKMRHMYGQFIDTVAAGRASRGLTVAKVDEIGRGHVWTGAMALSIGLVDRIGGLGDAIDEAVRRAGVPVGRDRLPEIELLPRAPLGLVRRLIGSADESARPDAPGGAGPGMALPAQLLTPDVRAALRLVAPLLLGPGSGLQARLPYDIDMR
jgi:protease-4